MRYTWLLKAQSLGENLALLGMVKSPKEHQPTRHFSLGTPSLSQTYSSQVQEGFLESAKYMPHIDFSRLLIGGGGRESYSKSSNVKLIPKWKLKIPSINTAHRSVPIDGLNLVHSPTSPRPVLLYNTYKIDAVSPLKQIIKPSLESASHSPKVQ